MEEEEEEEEEFYITDLFSINGESESTTIVINGESVEFRKYRVFVLKFSNFRRLFPFSDLPEIMGQQAQKESYEKCPIENWIKDYSPERACLILRGWSKEGYKITETNDMLKLLLVFLLSRVGDRIATKERDRITSKLIAEGKFVLIFEDKAILNFEQLSQLYREFITFSDALKSTTYKKLDIDVLLFSLFNDVKETNIKRRHDALYLLSKLSKRYFTSFIFGYDRPYFLRFYELFFRKFLNRYNMSKLHKVLLLTFLGIHVEFVDNFLFEVVLHPRELDYIFVESGYNRIEIGFVSKYVQILAYDGTIPKEKLEDLMTYLLKNSEEYFISNDNIRKKRFVFRKFKYSDAYLNQFETIPLNETTLRTLIVNKVLERPENSLEIKELYLKIRK